ncbi:hypothetical protein THAOC_02049, partial [Thalassiosira oceanica]
SVAISVHSIERVRIVRPLRLKFRVLSSNSAHEDYNDVVPEEKKHLLSYL